MDKGKERAPCDEVEGGRESSIAPIAPRLIAPDFSTSTLSVEDTSRDERPAKRARITRLQHVQRLLLRPQQQQQAQNAQQDEPDEQQQTQDSQQLAQPQDFQEVQKVAEQASASAGASASASSGDGSGPNMAAPARGTERSSSPAGAPACVWAKAQRNAGIRDVAQCKISHKQCTVHNGSHSACDHARCVKGAR